MEQALDVLVKKLYEIYDRPCEPNGDWLHVNEYQALDAKIRKMVGAPPARDNA